MNLWNEPDVPKTGWKCLGVQDLGTPSMTCEMCGLQQIRYAHTMTHEDYPESLVTGCVCAGNMEGDLTAAENREASLKTHIRRRDSWADRSWGKSRNGNPYTKVGGALVVLFPRDDLWHVYIERDGNKTYLNDFAEPYAARRAAFDKLHEMGLI